MVKLKSQAGRLEVATESDEDVVDLRGQNQAVLDGLGQAAQHHCRWRASN
jgi:hypothetical protein